MTDSLISLIIPAFNEEKTVGAVIQDIDVIMRLYGLPYEIIVVDDGSTDNTERVALSTGKATVLSNEPNHGKGYCLRRAFKQAHGDIIVTLDSDGEHKPREIPDLITPLFEGIDIVSGSRFLGSQSEVTTKINRMGNFLFNLAIIALTGQQVTDSQTGFRAMKRHILQELNLQSDGYEIESEITVKSLRNGYQFKEIPVTIERRKYNISKIKILRDGQKILSTIIQSSFSELEQKQNQQKSSFNANFFYDICKGIASSISSRSKFSRNTPEDSRDVP
jgi:glycosyltransferase involved in cell wall biosynthesis